MIVDLEDQGCENPLEEIRVRACRAGVNDIEVLLETWIEELEHYGRNEGATAPTPRADTHAVFVVHGRNQQLRNDMFNFLRSVKLSPIEWSEAVKQTGSAAPYIGDVLEAAFARAAAVVVLLTPDDVACLREEYRGKDEPLYETELTPQARPNVLFEAGMAMARHEHRTVLVQIGKLRPFSDVHGRHVLHFDGGPGSRKELIQDSRPPDATLTRMERIGFQSGNSLTAAARTSWCG